MKYIGLDLGEVSLGIARSDSGIIASSLMTYTFKREQYDQAVTFISNYINQEGIDVVVLGLPKHMHNEIGEKGALSIWFKDEILKHCKCEVVLWDERLTTKQATFTLKQAGLSEGKRKAKKDELAAQLILQNYLDYKSR